MCQNAVRARYLIDHVLKDVIAGGRMRLPKAAPGSGLDSIEFRDVLNRISGRIEDLPKSDASICTTHGRISLTTAWFCERWCSAYQLLKSVDPASIKHGQVLESIQTGEPFSWPESIPGPSTKNCSLVEQTNRIYPAVVVAAVLHEIGHAVNADRQCSRPDIELICDDFACAYLLGSRADQLRDVFTLGLAVWFCCLSSESLRDGSHLSVSHPSPVKRTQNFLKKYVQRDSETGSCAWLMCVGHVMRLARIHNRPALDEEDLTKKDYQTLDAILEDLKSCW